LYIVNLAHPNLWHSKCKNSTKYINFFSWFSWVQKLPTDHSMPAPYWFN
jgi:hypothetical protein